MKEHLHHHHHHHHHHYHNLNTGSGGHLHPHQNHHHLHHHNDHQDRQASLGVSDNRHQPHIHCPPLPHDHNHHHCHNRSCTTMTTTTTTTMMMMINIFIVILLLHIPTTNSLENKNILAPPKRPQFQALNDSHRGNTGIIFNKSNVNVSWRNAYPSFKQTNQDPLDAGKVDNIQARVIPNNNNNNNNNKDDAVQSNSNAGNSWKWPNKQGMPPPLQPSQEHLNNVWQGEQKFSSQQQQQQQRVPSLETSSVTSKLDSRTESWKYAIQNPHWNSLHAITPEPKVDPDVRNGVEWNYNANYYSLKASSDSKFLIRYAPPPSAGTPWPMPQFYSPMFTVLRIDPNELQFRVTFEGEKRPTAGKPEAADFYDASVEAEGECSVMDFTISRIKKIAFGGHWDRNEGALVDDEYAEAPRKETGGTADDGHSPLKEIVIRIKGSCEKEPHLNMNESYSLKVTPTSAILTSSEIWGAVRGLETFSQLIYQKDIDPFKYWINATAITDFPRFKHRGVLLDTARHYLEVSLLLENLESMAQNKFNVFHWHIVDDQSFPFKSYSYPNLTKQGAFDYDTHIYTHEDIELIIEQARLRGIRVIPEFDTPGHTFSWGFGQSHLLTPCYSFNGDFNGLYGPINPILRKNYNFLKSFFKEVMSVFKDKYLHLGGDEVPFECWLSNPQIKRFMKKNFISDIKQLLSFYARQLISLVANNAKELKRKTGSIVWQEMFDNDVELPLDTIIQVWSGDSYDLERITRMGYGVLFSTCWYLDYIQYGQDWDKYYICDHIANLRLKNESLFYGGEVCLWAEYTDDSDILTRLWPRASAAAERLWSNKNVNNLYRAAPRLEMQRCRMMERGLDVGVLSGPSHCPKFRKKRKQRLQKDGVNNGDNKLKRDDGALHNAANEEESYLQDDNQDKRRLNRYGSNRDRQSHYAKRIKVPESSKSFSDSAPDGVTLYLVGCFAFFLICFVLKKKWVRLPLPTYFFIRNYRAFVVCLIILTAGFIWLQHIRFFPSNLSSSITRPKDGRMA